MVDLIATLTPDAVAGNLARIREEIAAAGRDPATVEILAAIKYLPADLLPALAQGGVKTVGENRAQRLAVTQDAYPNLFPRWDFIGTLQSRKVKDLLGRVRYIHSVASESALAQIARHRASARPGLEVLIEVNVAGEQSKSGIDPADLSRYLERCALPVAGLMTMPPQTATSGGNRRHFAALRELAGAHGLTQLSMGTSQDYLDAIREGATIVRLGTTLYRSRESRGGAA